jgi:hypothetical protein
MSVPSSVEEKKRKQAKNGRMLGIIGSSRVILVKRHTHYPVPGGVKASIMVNKELKIFVHTKRAVDLNHHASRITHHASCIIDGTRQEQSRAPRN